MNRYLIVSTTTGTKEVAERIAIELMDRRLAACIQISGPISSTYRWQGKVETTDEWLCTIKTGEAQVSAIEQVLKEMHPYEVPELIATPIVAGSKAYLEWMEGELAAL